MSLIKRHKIEQKISDLSPIHKRTKVGNNRIYYSDTANDFKDCNVGSLDYSKLKDFILTTNNNLSFINDIKEIDQTSSPNKNVNFESTDNTTYRKKILGNSLNRKFNKSIKTKEIKPSNNICHLNLIECQKTNSNVSVDRKLSESLNLNNFNELHTKFSSKTQKLTNLMDESKENSILNKNNIKEPKINKASGMFNSKLFSNVYKTENK